MKKRAPLFLALARGLLAAIGTTLVGMLLLAAAVLYLDLSDQALSLGNQILKLAAIFLGVRFAVGIGGARGFLTGATVAGLYMALGYAMYGTLGGMPVVPAQMLLEIILGALVGGLFGTLFANLQPRKRGKFRKSAHTQS